MGSKIFPRIVLVCFLAANGSLGFQPPPSATWSRPRLREVQPACRCDCSLQMGLRSFLKKKVLGRDEAPSGGASKTTNTSEKLTRTQVPKAKKNTTTTAVEVPEKTVTKPAVARAVDEGSNESKQQSRLPPLRKESVKEKLNRVRSGQMTDDEKQAFLRTALSAKESSTSRKPLRQKLPDDRNEGDRPPNNNATPFPKDSLLKNVLSSGSQKNTQGMDMPVRTWHNGARLEDEKKKREYYAMVTDPNRFNTYKSSVVTSPGETSTMDVTHDGVFVPQIDDEEEELSMEEAFKETIAETDDTGEEYVRMAAVAGDLGTRLEKAAIALEEAAKLKEKERREQEARLEQHRLEQKKRLEEIQRKQQLELEKRELELKAKKREEEEAKVREMEKRRNEEEARRQKMILAQDEYWAKKLAVEREARMKGMSEQQKEDFVKQEAWAQKAMASTREEIEEPLPSPASLTKAILKPEEPTIRLMPSLGAKKAKSSSRANQEQAWKQQEMERAKEEQIARIRALNSPLPTPVTQRPPASTPVMPQRDRSMRGASELSKLMNPPMSAPVPAIPIQPPKSEPTISEMMSKFDEKPDPAEASMGGGGFLSGFISQKKEASIPARKESIPQQEKRVVRQALPLGDDADDFDTFDRNGPNRQMSIADAMSASGTPIESGDQDQRSKKWGVDMSRIVKSLEEEKKRGK